MRFLSIQSHVAYGHVGNSAAVFPLQRIGHEVWPVLTVNFSNHTGYGSWGGPLIPADDVRAVVTGIEDRGVLGMNAVMMEEYLQFIANRRLVQIGLPEQFKGVKNPFPWMSEIMDLRKENNFFETRVIEYQTGGALSWD